MKISVQTGGTINPETTEYFFGGTVEVKLESTYMVSLKTASEDRLITASAKSGYTFSGWYYGSTKISTSITKVPDSGTLTAKFSSSTSSSITFSVKGSISDASGSAGYVTSSGVVHKVFDWSGTSGKSNSVTKGLILYISPQDVAGYTISSISGGSWTKLSNNWWQTKSSVSSAISSTVNYTANKYTLTFDSDGGTAVSPKYNQVYGSSITLPTISKNKNRYNCFVYAYNDSTKTKLVSTTSFTCYTTYDFSGWYSSLKKQTFGGGDVYEVSGDDEFTADWESTNNPSKLGSAIPAKDKAYMLGYTNNYWTTDGNTQIDRESEFSSNVSIYMSYLPIEYNYQYVLDKGESWEEDPQDTIVYKTFGQLADLTTRKVSKFGYTFKGWQWVAEDGTTYKYNTVDNIEQIDDKPFIKLNSNKTTRIKITPWFEPTPNTIIFRYYYYDNGYKKELNEVETYTIETKTDNESMYVKRGPSGGREMGEDYVFTGWAGETTNPNNVPGWFNDTTKGIFANNDVPPEEADKNNPLKINVTKVTEWGAPTVYYYGTWTRTGKYVKVGSSWKKVSVVYVKDGDRWRSISEMKVKIPIETSEGEISEWKDEIS